jgi:hypothetical protein
MKFPVLETLSPLQQQINTVDRAKKNLSMCHSTKDKMDAMKWVIEEQDKLIKLLNSTT